MRNLLWVALTEDLDALRGVKSSLFSARLKAAFFPTNQLIQRVIQSQLEEPISLPPS